MAGFLGGVTLLNDYMYVARDRRRGSSPRCSARPRPDAIRIVGDGKTVVVKI